MKEEIKLYDFVLFKRPKELPNLEYGEAPYQVTRIDFDGTGTVSRPPGLNFGVENVQGLKKIKREEAYRMNTALMGPWEHYRTINISHIEKKTLIFRFIDKFPQIFKSPFIEALKKINFGVFRIRHHELNTDYPQNRYTGKELNKEYSLVNEYLIENKLKDIYDLDNHLFEIYENALKNTTK